ncbi:unnamed protein product [Schistosoma spindalis]|nr:unnamed protein product [Schistosoma spindale]
MTSDVRNSSCSNNTQNLISNHRTNIPPELKTISRLNTSGNSFVSSTEDQLRTHQQTLEHWLLNAVIHTFAKFSSSHKSLELLTRFIGLPTSLACALSYYIPESLKALSTEGKLDQVCLDHYLSLLNVLETTTLSIDTINYNFQHGLFKDDIENVQCINNIIQRLFKTNKLLCEFNSLFTSITQLLNLYLKKSPNERIGFEKYDDLCLVINIYQLICNISTNITVTSSSHCYHSTSTIISSSTGVNIAITTSGLTSTTGIVTNPIQSDIVQSNYNSKIQNGVLRNLVRASGTVAKPAIPAHPSNQPIPVVNQSTVDQLVSSPISLVNHTETMIDDNSITTAAATTTIGNTKADVDTHSTDFDKLKSFNNVDNSLISSNNTTIQNVYNVTNDGTNDLLTDIARVAFNRSHSTPCKAVINNEDKLLQQQQINISTNGHYYLNKKCSKLDVDSNPVNQSTTTTEITTISDTTTNAIVDDDTQSFKRNSLYVTFNKRPTPCLSSKLPSIGSLSQPNNPLKRLGTKSPRVNSVTNVNLSQVTLPSLRSEFEKRKRSMSTVTTADVDQISKIHNDLPLGTTTWKDSGAARSHTHKVNDAVDTKDNIISSSSTKSDQEATMFGRAAALRLSLDQRRRAIEVSRQRERLASTKAAAERNNAAFVKLLQKQFHQRHSISSGQSQLSNGGTVSENENSSSSLPLKLKESEKYNFICIDSEGTHFATDKDEMTVSGSNVEHATDLDEDFSMNSSSTVPNVSEPLQDSTVFIETSDTIGLVDNTTNIFVNDSKTSVSPCSKPPQIYHDRTQSNDHSDLTVEPTTAHINNRCDPPYQEFDQNASVTNQRSDSGESNYATPNVSFPHIITLDPSKPYQTLPHQHKRDSKRPKSRFNERESTPQPELFTEVNYHYAPPQYSQTHKGSRQRVYADKTHPGFLSSSASEYNEHGFVLVDSFQSPSFKHRHTNHKNNPYDIPTQSPVDERPLPHKHISQRYYRSHNVPNQMMLSGGYRECSSNEASSETDGDDEDDYSTRTYDDHSYPYINRMSYSGRFSHRSLSRLPKSHSKNRYRSNGRKSSEYGYELGESESRTHSPAPSYASSRGVASSRGHKVEINSIGGGNNRPSVTSVVDPVTLDQINRNMSDLRSDFERLSMQQQVLLASSSATTAAALMASSFQQQHQQYAPQQSSSTPLTISQLSHTQALSTSISNISTTRATWSDRPIVRDLIVQHNVHSSTDNSHSVTVDDCVEHNQINTDEPVVIKADTHNMVAFNEPSHSGKPQECSTSANNVTDLSNSSTAPLNPSPVENSQKHMKSPIVKAPNVNPEGKLFFIGFEEPDPERMQRTKDRLEARRATERAMVAEQLEALRTTGRKEKEAADRAQFERKLNEKERREAVLQAHLSKKETALSPCCRTTTNNSNNPYPVRSGSSTLSKSEVNLSSTVPKHSSTKRLSATPKRDRNGLVAASLDNFPSSKPNSRLNSAKSKPHPSAITRGSGDGEAVEPNTEPDCDSSSFRETKARVTHNRPVSGRSVVNNLAGRNPLPSGISLSSLHRLGALESPSSGPGVPVQCLNQPRLFVKPKAKSNRTVVVNAISHCCLAGTVNEPTKQLALKELAATEGTHFMILFRDSRCQYRAVYSFDLESEELKIICGNGPRRITHEMVNRFFKYNSGSKQFTEITSTKHLSPVVDAITIHDALWSKSSGGGTHAILSSHCT